MKNNPKKGPFDLSIDLTKIPSFRGRFASMDNLTGGTIDMTTQKCDLDQARDAEPNLREKLRSGQDVIIRDVCDIFFICLINKISYYC